MRIDFTMGGINLMLLIGIVILLQGICFLIMQNPFKKIKRFSARDFILFGIIICLITVGLALTVVGLLNMFRIIG